MNTYLSMDVGGTNIKIIADGSVKMAMPFRFTTKAALLSALDQLSNDNAQAEYYLTDCVVRPACC